MFCFGIETGGVDLLSEKSLATSVEGEGEEAK